MKRVFVFAALGILCASPAFAFGFGDVVRVVTGGAVDPDRREVCVGPLCVNDKGKTRTKTLDETIDDQVGQAVPGYVVLSDEDKAKVRGAVKSTGVILASTTMDPITGGIVIKIITGDKKEEVLVPSYTPNPPPTEIKYNLAASCLIQRDATSITAAFLEEVPDLLKVNAGDTVNLTAPICPGMGQSITSVIMIATSKATPVTTSSKFKWVLLGNIKP
jgi:hypothetical protein